MLDKIRENQVVTERTQLISPLINLTKNSLEFREAKRKICAEHNVSEKKLLRLYNNYIQYGVDGLKKKERTGNTSKIPEDVINRAIELRKEVPRRSVTMIIRILEAEKIVEPDTLRRTTLQEALEKRGYSAKAMRDYGNGTVYATRYQMECRNEMWIGDMKDGPTLMIDGKETKTYLSVLIDDYSRHIVFGRFFTSKNKQTVAASLRSAFDQYGLPGALYFDNGGGYKNGWMSHCCNTLHIDVHYCRPYSPWSKGKVEAFFNYVNQFMLELKITSSTTLDDLNRWFNAWLLKDYEHKTHSAVKEMPEARYNEDTTELRYLPEDVMELAFKCIERRNVGNCGEFKFYGNTYLAGTEFRGKRILVYYRANDYSVLYTRNSDGNMVEMRISKRKKFADTPKPKKPAKVQRTSNYLETIAGDVPDEGVQMTIDQLTADTDPSSRKSVIRYDTGSEV